LVFVRQSLFLLSKCFETDSSRFMKQSSSSWIFLLMSTYSCLCCLHLLITFFKFSDSYLIFECSSLISLRDWVKKAYSWSLLSYLDLRSLSRVCNSVNLMFRSSVSPSKNSCNSLIYAIDFSIMTSMFCISLIALLASYILFSFLSVLYWTL